jgi:copper chaperone CopZ
MEKATFKISGMSCKSCAKIIELELADEKGIASAAVNFSDSRAFLEFNSKEITPLAIKGKIEHLGYKAAEEK